MFTDYLGTIRRKLWLIIILPLLAAGAAFVFSTYLMQPVYEANTTFYIDNIKSDQALSINTDDMVARQYLVKDYMEIIKSRAVTLEVINQLNLQLNEEELAKNITVAAKDNTSLLEIKVKSEDLKLSMDIANRIGSVFVQKTTELIGLNRISIVDAAVMPVTPVTPSIAANTCLAFFTAMVMALFIAFLASYVNSKILTEKDVQKYLKLDLLGTIPTLKI